MRRLALLVVCPGLSIMCMQAGTHTHTQTPPVSYRGPSQPSRITSKSIYHGAHPWRLAWRGENRESSGKEFAAELGGELAGGPSGELSVNLAAQSSPACFRRSSGEPSGNGPSGEPKRESSSGEA